MVDCINSQGMTESFFWRELWKNAPLKCTLWAGRGKNDTNRKKRSDKVRGLIKVRRKLALFKRGDYWWGSFSHNRERGGLFLCWLSIPGNRSDREEPENPRRSRHKSKNTFTIQPVTGKARPGNRVVWARFWPCQLTRHFRRLWGLSKNGQRARRKQYPIQNSIQEALLVINSCDRSTMRWGSEDVLRKATVSVNAFIRGMKGNEERSGLKGISADEEGRVFSVCRRESHKRARDDCMSCPAL